MKKLLISFSLLVFHFSFSSGQTWDSLRRGLSGNGSFEEVVAINQYQGNIFAVGRFDSSGTLYTNCVAQWNGLGWDSVGLGVIPFSANPSFGGAYAEAIYNGNLFVGGEFRSPLITGYSIAQWDGVKWDSVGSGMRQYSLVTSLQVYNGNLYAAGLFSYVGGETIWSIAQWNGTHWDSVSSGTQSWIYALTVYNGELYAAGSFDTIGHIYAQNIAKWNGTNWSTVGLGIDSVVNSLTVYNGNLYAGGCFKQAGGVPAKNIAIWNGVNWNSVGGGISVNTNYSGVFALAQYGSILCAGGQFDSAGNKPANNIAYWDGSTWSAMGSGISGGPVYCLYSTPLALYIGGAFDKAGGIRANNIAKWSSPLAVNNLKDNNEIVTVFPNPSSGSFTLSLSNPDSYRDEKCSVEIYNVMGEKVQTSSLPSPLGEGASLSYNINLSNQPNGVYFYRVVKESGELVGSGKLIIQK